MTTTGETMKYRSTITIYSDFDPTKVELSELAREAEEGSAYCSECRSESVPDSELPEGVAEWYADWS